MGRGTSLGQGERGIEVRNWCMRLHAWDIMSPRDTFLLVLGERMLSTKVVRHMARLPEGNKEEPVRGHDFGDRNVEELAAIVACRTKWSENPHAKLGTARGTLKIAGREREG